MEIEDFDKFQKDQRWTHAKNYAHFCPHWYLVRTKIADVEGFNNFLNHIETHGVFMQWGKFTRKYYDRGEYRYWHMQSAGTLDQVIIINREKIATSMCKEIRKPIY